MLSKTQLRLYRAVLKRFFPDATGSDAIGTCGTKIDPDCGVCANWRIFFDTSTALWTYSVTIADTVSRSGSNHRLSALVEAMWEDVNGELDAAQAFHYFEMMQEDGEAAALTERVEFDNMLAAIPLLNDEVLRSRLSDAYDERARAWDDVGRWGWDPSYAGPDDPGLAYYERVSEYASLEVSALESEASKRGLPIRGWEAAAA